MTDELDYEPPPKGENSEQIYRRNYKVGGDCATPDVVRKVIGCLRNRFNFHPMPWPSQGVVDCGSFPEERDILEIGDSFSGEIFCGDEEIPKTTIRIFYSYRADGRVPGCFKVCLRANGDSKLNEDLLERIDGYLKDELIVKDINYSQNFMPFP